jgi:hypothetical protein
VPAAYQSDGGTVFCASANNNGITVPLPATRPVGSVLLMVVFNRLITATVALAPDGYTLLPGFPLTSATASGGRIWVYARVVDGTETAPQISLSGTTGTSGDLWGACLYCYSGVDLSGGISAILDGTPTTTDASGTTTCTYPALTISLADSMIVRTLFRIRDAADTFTPTATWNEREDLGSTIRTGGQHHLQDKLATASGVQAAVTVAPSNTTAARYLAVTLALKSRPPQAHSRTPADGIALSDEATPVKTAGGVAHSRTPADGIALADARSKAVGKGWADAFALVDARTRRVGYARPQADALGLTDQVAPGIAGADSVLFDGDDQITLALGGMPTFGPGMLGWIIKTGPTGGFNRVIFEIGPGPAGLYRRDGDKRVSFYEGTERPGPVLDDDKWYACFFTKASGSVTPRWHVYDYGTEAWTHQDAAGGTMANYAPSGSPKIGGSGGEEWVGNILIGGAWAAGYSDGALEALGLENDFQGWVDTPPREGWRTKDLGPIQSFGTVGTADETSRTGTAVDAGDSPPGWSDEIGAPAVDFARELVVVL